MNGYFFTTVATERNTLKGGGTMRNGLYMFRHGLRLSQSEMAAKIGCSRATYSMIECGSRDGTMRFWEKLRTAFAVPYSELGDLMRNDEKEGA